MARAVARRAAFTLRRPGDSPDGARPQARAAWPPNARQVDAPARAGRAGVRLPRPAAGASSPAPCTCRCSSRTSCKSMAQDQYVRADRDPRAARRHLRPPRRAAGPERRRRLDLDRPVDAPRPAGSPPGSSAEGARPRHRTSCFARLQKAPALRLGEAPGDARRGGEGEGAGAARRRLHQGAAALLPAARAGRARASAWSAPTATASTASSCPSRTSCPATRHPARASATRKGRKLITTGVEDADRAPGRHRSPSPSTASSSTLTEKALRARRSTTPRPPPAWRWCSTRSTGEILALANTPRFNPNSPQEAAKDALRNRAATDAFEPGSTFKAFVVAAALEEKADHREHRLRHRERRLDHRQARHPRHPPARHLDAAQGAPGQLQHRRREDRQPARAREAGRALLREVRLRRAHRPGAPRRGQGPGALPEGRRAPRHPVVRPGHHAPPRVQMAAAYGALANGGRADEAVPGVEGGRPRRRGAAGEQAHRGAPGGVERGRAAPWCRCSRRGGEGRHRPQGPHGRVPRGRARRAPRRRPTRWRAATPTSASPSFVGMVPAEDPRLVMLVVIDEPEDRRLRRPRRRAGLQGDRHGRHALPRRCLLAPASRAAQRQGRPAGRQPLRILRSAAASGPSSRPGRRLRRAQENVIEEARGRAWRCPGPGPSRKGRAEAVAQLLAAALEPRLAGSGRVATQRPAAGSLVEQGKSRHA